ncbi:MAG: hypothetical protein P3W87_000785 [Gammaproteobacteria bacterium]|nr:hypothetical protein [Gammaproteobacteria bacterium]
MELVTPPPMPTPLRARLFPGEGPAEGLTPVMDVARTLLDGVIQEEAA